MEDFKKFVIDSITDIKKSLDNINRRTYELEENLQEIMKCGVNSVDVSIINRQQEFIEKLDETYDNIYNHVLKALLYNIPNLKTKEIKCENCKNYKNDGCPNSAECYSTKDKKYFEPKA